MNRERHVDRVLESWFADGPTELPNQSVAAIVDQLDDIEQRGRWLPGRKQMNRMILAIGGGVAVLAISVLGLAYFYGPLGPARPSGPVHTSDRQGYSIQLPDDSWQVTEVPGTLDQNPFGSVVDDTQPGTDVFKKGAEPFEGRNAVWIATQSIPAGRTFDDWVAAHDAENQSNLACFTPQGNYEYRMIDGERARVVVQNCPEFGDSGVAWAALQVLVAHEGKAYAIYVWPLGGSDMPSVDEIKAQGLRWLAGFSFTN